MSIHCLPSELFRFHLWPDTAQTQQNFLANFPCIWNNVNTEQLNAFLNPGLWRQLLYFRMLQKNSVYYKTITLWSDRLNAEDKSALWATGWTIWLAYWTPADCYMRIRRDKLFLWCYCCSVCCLTNTDVCLNNFLIDFKCIQLSKQSLHSSTNSPLSCREQAPHKRGFSLLITFKWMNLLLQ